MAYFRSNFSKKSASALLRRADAWRASRVGHYVSTNLGARTQVTLRTSFFDRDFEKKNLKKKINKWLVENFLNDRFKIIFSLQNF
jgi:hypothetical protein